MGTLNTIFQIAQLVESKKAQANLTNLIREKMPKKDVEESYIAGNKPVLGEGGMMTMQPDVQQRTTQQPMYSDEQISALLGDEDARKALIGLVLPKDESFEKDLMENLTTALSESRVIPRIKPRLETGLPEGRLESPAAPLANLFNRQLQSPNLELAEQEKMIPPNAQTQAKLKALMQMMNFSRSGALEKGVAGSLFGGEESQASIGTTMDKDMLGYGYSRMGARILQPKGREEFLNFLATPEGQKGLSDYIITKEGEKAAPTYSTPMIAPKTGHSWVFGREAGKPVWINMNNGERTTSPPPELADIKLRPLPVEVTRGLTMAMTMKDTLGRIRDRMADFSDQIGPIEGRQAKLNNALVGDKDFQKLMGELFTMITLVYSLSGQQSSDPEMERFNKNILPHVEDPDARVEGKLEILDEYISSLYNNQLDTFKQTRYNTGNLSPMKPNKYSFEKTKSKRPSLDTFWEE